MMETYEEGMWNAYRRGGLMDMLDYMAKQELYCILLEPDPTLGEWLDAHATLVTPATFQPTDPDGDPLEGVVVNLSVDGEYHTLVHRAVDGWDDQTEAFLDGEPLPDAVDGLVGDWVAGRPELGAGA